MLEHLRQRVVDALQQESTVTLATSGPAGLEISPCESKRNGLNLILLIPATSEHWVNIEAQPLVAVTQDHWRLTGTAMLPYDTTILSEAVTAELKALEVHPLRFEFLTQNTHQVVETIDIGDDD